MALEMDITRIVWSALRIGIAFPIVAALLGITYLLSIWLYRIFFHPYAKYPGPFLAKFSNVYAAYHSYKGDLHIDIWRCHQKYGDMVRYAPDRLLFNSPQAIKDIYSSGEKNVTKSKAYEAMMHRVPNTITLRDRIEHARRRRILAPGFNDSAIKSYEGRIKVIVKRLINALSPTAEQASEKEWSESKNLADWSNCVFFDLANDLIFGQDWNSIENPDRRFVVTAIQGSNVRAGVLSNAAELKWQRLDKKLPIFHPSIISRGHFIVFIKETVFKKMTAKTKEKDIFSTLVHAEDSETGTRLNEEELAAETANLISAGSDTSSTTLAALFFYLSRNQACYDRAAAEVRSVFASPKDVSIGASLNSCTYLRACLDEALRMAPTVASAPWREVTAPAIIAGEHIPVGLDVGMGIYSIQHNEKYIPQPFKFIPGRWLLDEDSELSSREQIDASRSVYNPFSSGPRSCIGKALATAELMFIMASVLTAFDFKKASGEEGKLGEGDPKGPWGRHRPEEYQMIDHVICAKEGPMLQFRAK